MKINEIRNKVKTNRIIYYLLLIPYFPIRCFRNYKENIIKKKIVKENYSRLNNIHNKNNIYYFGIPAHPNIGDMAQTYCTKKWINKNYPNMYINEFNTCALLNKRFLKELKKYINEDDLIFMQSGYCSHQGHADHKMHKLIISLFYKNKIIVLPQTVNITSTKEWYNTKKVFEKNEKVIFMTRDDVSYNETKKHLNITLMNYPDIVTTLIGTRNINYKKKGILLCVRNDGEKYYKSSEYNELIRKLETLNINVDITDTTISNMDRHEFYTKFETILNNTIENFSKYKVIITDRYHGTIISSIANTQVIVLKTNDHKVSSGVDWFIKNDYKNIRLAKNINEAYLIAEKLYNDDSICYNPNTFETKYYDCLKQNIDNIYENTKETIK